MCLLTFLPAGVQPDTGALRHGTYGNDEGHGFAIVAGDHLVIGRGMDAETMIAVFAEARRRHRQGPALFHSRLATHGRSALENCHPFPVGADERTVLAHNGVFPETVPRARGDARSDTRVVAEEFLPAFGSLRTRGTRLRFQRWMTPTNKVVILTVDRRFTERAYILNENCGIWDGGIWYSNDGYLPPPPRRRRPKGSRPDWATRAPQRLARCQVCGALIDVLDGNCPYCGWCLGCRAQPDDCSCYTPAARERHQRQARLRARHAPVQ
jgi:hypothetical protein